jgi:hypothetical protein
MNTTIESLVAEIDAVRIRLLAAIEGVTQEQLDRRPSEEKWSAGEILHHLARSEQGIAIMLARGITRARTAGIAASGAVPPRPTRLDDVGIERGARPSVAPSTLEPKRGMARDEILAALERSRVSLKSALADSDDVELSALRFPHPVLGELDPYEWIDFIGRHEQRHLGQIETAMAR